MDHGFRAYLFFNLTTRKVCLYVCQTNNGRFWVALIPKYPFFFTAGAGIVEGGIEGQDYDI